MAPRQIPVIAVGGSALRTSRVRRTYRDRSCPTQPSEIPHLSRYFHHFGPSALDPHIPTVTFWRYTTDIPAFSGIRACAICMAALRQAQGARGRQSPRFLEKT